MKSEKPAWVENLPRVMEDLRLALTQVFIESCLATLAAHDLRADREWCANLADSWDPETGKFG